MQLLEKYQTPHSDMWFHRPKRHLRPSSSESILHYSFPEWCGFTVREHITVIEFAYFWLSKVYDKPPFIGTDQRCSIRVPCFPIFIQFSHRQGNRGCMRWYSGGNSPNGKWGKAVWPRWLCVLVQIHGNCVSCTRQTIKSCGSIKHVFRIPKV